MGEIAYQHDLAKLADSGLNLNLPVDLVPKTEYPIFSNVLSTIEGLVKSREGMALVCNLGTTPVHSIFRLNQYSSAILGSRLFGIGSQLYAAPLPAGNTPALLTGGIAYDGTPLSIIGFRFDADPQIWAIIANGAGMMKFKAGYYQLLGIAPPMVPAQYSAGGAGNLDSGSGPGYDWLYTYYNPITQSESNPSPANQTSTETLAPTAFTNPDPSLPGPIDNPYLNPGNVFDGNPATFASYITPPVPDQGSCQWNMWGTPTGLYSDLVLYVTSEVLNVTIPNAGVSTRIQYSFDGGLSWQNIFFVGTNRPLTTDAVNVPPTINLADLRVRAISNAGGTVTAEARIYEISTIGTLIPPVPTLLPLSNQSALVCVTPPTDPQATQINLYRRGGSLVDNYYYVSTSTVAALSQGVCSPTALEIIDNSSDATIEGNPTVPLDNFQPVDSVQVMNQPIIAIWGYEGRVFGCGDPARPGVVYWSNSGNADEWGAENWIDVAEAGGQVMNGVVYALRCFVFSRERMSVLLPNIIQGSTFTPAETSCRKGLKGRWALTIGEKGIYFGAKDGIYRTQGGAEESVTDATIRPLFPTFENTQGTPVNGYDAVDMSDENGLRLSYHNGEIWYDYTGLTTGIRQRLIYDERRNRWRGAPYTPTMQTSYSEPGTVSSLLFGSTDGNVFQAGNGSTDNSATIPCHFRTGSFDQSAPLNLKEYGGVAIDIDPGGATGSILTIQAYLNGNLVPGASKNVTGTGRQRVFMPLADAYGLNVSFDFQWNASASVQPVLYQLDILYRHEPSTVTHWELPPNSLGMDGWFHVRDSYVTLRSAANVTMVLNFDNGPSQTFILTSTSGSKRKLYVPFGANKCKLVGMTLDSTGDFRVYSSETELRAKMWLTRLGYKALPIIGAISEGGSTSE